MNRIQTKQMFEAKLAGGITIDELWNGLKELGGISAQEQAGAIDFFNAHSQELAKAGVAPDFRRWLERLQPLRDRIEQHNSAVEADQPRLEAAMWATLQPGVTVKTLDGGSTVSEGFKKYIREGLKNGDFEAVDPRFLRDNPIAEDNPAIVGEDPVTHQGNRAIITTGKTNPYGGQETQNASTLAYSNCAMTGPIIERDLKVPQRRLVDVGTDRDGKTHKTEYRVGTWDGAVDDQYLEGHNIAPEAVAPNHARWSGHFALTTHGPMALPYTRMSAAERNFLTTVSLMHEGADYRMLAWGHFRMREGKVVDIGLSGRLAKAARDGEFKVCDVVEALRLFGIPVADGVQLSYEG